jgi:hypothetical protein
MRRQESFIAGLCLGGAILLAPAAPALAGVGGGAQFFLDPLQFEQTLGDIGKIGKGSWDFKPDFMPPDSVIGIDDVLDINTHPVNAPGVWQDTAGVNLWPPEIDNVQFSSNLTPAGPWTPRGPQGLAYAKPSFSGLTNNFLGANFPDDSFDIISGPPAGDNHTAISFEMLGIAGTAPPFFLVSVYNKNEELIGEFSIDGGQNQKIFVGVIAPPGDTIQRIDIWDQNGGFEGISSIALYLQQAPWCPWDCAVPADKEINVVDFLALLAQWGIVGAPCDFDGGGVGVTDFLKLLAVWGPCPTAPNDECVDKITIDRFDASGVYTEHFDMYGATPSPEPIQCGGGIPNPYKDIWYCLRNSSNEDKLVTLSGTVDLFVEVTDGCVCPPGPLVACGILIDGNTSFPMAPGQDVCIRLINDLELPNDQIKGNLIIVNEPITGEPVNFYGDAGLFFEDVFAAGKEEKLFWDFKPSNQPVCLPFDGPLDINSHFNIVGDPWTGPGGENLWPPFVDNVQFWTNANPQGPFTPGDILGYCTAGTQPDLDNNALFEGAGPFSFEIFSGPPAGDNHTAMAFEVLTVAGVTPGTVPAILHITVFDKNDNEIGKFVFTTTNGAKTFVGILTKDPTVTISRVDIWDELGGFEGISAVWAFLQPIAATCDEPFTCGGPIVECPPVGSGCFCFKRTDGTGQCGLDSSCADLQPCPNGDGDCPPGFFCAIDTCCGEPVCLPECGSVAPAAPPTGLTTTGFKAESLP